MDNHDNNDTTIKQAVHGGGRRRKFVTATNNDTQKGVLYQRGDNTTMRP